MPIMNLPTFSSHQYEEEAQMLLGVFEQHQPITGWLISAGPIR